MFTRRRDQRRTRLGLDHDVNAMILPRDSSRVFLSRSDSHPKTESPSAVRSLRDSKCFPCVCSLFLSTRTVRYHAEGRLRVFRLNDDTGNKREGEEGERPGRDGKERPATERPRLICKWKGTEIEFYVRIEPAIFFSRLWWRKGRKPWRCMSARFHVEQTRRHVTQRRRRRWRLRRCARWYESDRRTLTTLGPGL